MIAVLTDTGHITDERRQEFILWSDTLGLSMLVDALANELPAGATESTVLGPFYVPGSPLREYGESMVIESGAGVPAWVYGRVLDVAGKPIAGAELDVWQNGADMLYAVQRPDADEDHLRGRYLTRADGTLRVRRGAPGPVPDPRRRPRRRDARGHRPPPVATGAHPHDRPRRRLQDRHHAHLRRDERVPRLGHRVRGQAVAAARRSSSARRTIPSARRASTASGSRSRTTSCSRRSGNAGAVSIRGAPPERSAPRRRTVRAVAPLDSYCSSVPRYYFRRGRQDC